MAPKELDRTLVVIGSGPGIGVSVAQTFASNGFNKVALLARRSEQLQKDKTAVIDASAEHGSPVKDVKTWSVDISDLKALKSTLSEVESFGPVGCVFFNAARVAPSTVLETPVEILEEDFKITNLALYETAQWAIPLLQKNGVEQPSLLVTNSMLYKEPVSFVFSLSLVKAAQRSLVLSLHDTYGKDTHIALVSVEGQVSPDKDWMSPKFIAGKVWELYSQPKESWTRDIEILEK